MEDGGDGDGGGVIVKDEPFCDFEEKKHHQLRQGNYSIMMTSKAVKGEEVSEDVVLGNKMANLQALTDKKLKVLLDLVPGANEVSGKMRGLGMLVDYVILLKYYHIKAFHGEPVILKIGHRIKPLADVKAEAVILQNLFPGGKEVTDEAQLLGKLIDYIILLKGDDKVKDGEQMRYMAGDKILKYNNNMVAMLNDLVPGCSEVTCMEQVVDKIINYIELLKRHNEEFYGEPGKHMMRAKLAQWQDMRNKLAILQDLVPEFIVDIDGLPVFDKLILYVGQLKHGNKGRHIPFHCGSGSKRNAENHSECPFRGKRMADRLAWEESSSVSRRNAFHGENPSKRLFRGKRMADRRAWEESSSGSRRNAENHSERPFHGVNPSERPFHGVKMADRRAWEESSSGSRRNAENHSERPFRGVNPSERPFHGVKMADRRAWEESSSGSRRNAENHSERPFRGVNPSERPFRGKRWTNLLVRNAENHSERPFRGVNPSERPFRGKRWTNLLVRNLVQGLEGMQTLESTDFLDMENSGPWN